MSDIDVRGGFNYSCLETPEGCHQYVDLDVRTGTGHCGVCHERQPMREVALIFDKEGRPLAWSDDSKAQGCAIPDSRNLWDAIWDYRQQLGGVAHTHPWDGPTGPSSTDLTTFAALEKGLGLRLVWPIITMTHELYLSLAPSDDSVYLELFPPPFASTAVWKAAVNELRRRSRNGG